MAAFAGNQHVGEKLNNDIDVYRAFIEKGDRRRGVDCPHKVRPACFMLREEDVADGLSVGKSPLDAVKGLNSNEGYCRISVATIHNLPFQLDVRQDLQDEGHAFIRNLPQSWISDEMRRVAQRIANELARLAVVETCDRFLPN